MSFELPPNKENIFKTLQSLQDDQQIEVVFKKKASKTDKDVVEEVRVFKKPSGLFAWLVKLFKSQGQQSATVVQLMKQLFTENTPKEGFEALAKMSARFSASRNPKLSSTKEYLTKLYQAALPDQNFTTMEYFKHYHEACKNYPIEGNLLRYEKKLIERFVKDPKEFAEAVEVTYRDPKSTPRLKSFLLSCLYENDLFGPGLINIDQMKKQEILQGLINFIKTKKNNTDKTLFILLYYCLEHTGVTQQLQKMEQQFRSVQNLPELTDEHIRDGYAEVLAFLAYRDREKASHDVSLSTGQKLSLRNRSEENIQRAKENGSWWGANMA